MLKRWFLPAAALILLAAIAIAPATAFGQEAECVTGNSLTAQIVDNLDVKRADRLLGAEARAFLVDTGASEAFSSVTVRADIMRVVLNGDDYALVVASDARGCSIATGTLPWDMVAPLLPVGA